jgi:ubiquinone/menaquinone biosynthesis C-methylase UbiE
MKPQDSHPLLVTPLHDEESRQLFTHDFRKFIAAQVTRGNRPAYEVVAKLAYAKDHGEEPKSHSDVAQAFRKNPTYQFYSAMQRNCQEMSFDGIIDSIERDLPNLIERALEQSGNSGGSLTLADNFEAPDYLTVYDIHLQPGSYTASACEGDISAGLLYERSTYLYSMGYMGPKLDYLAKSLIRHFRNNFPDRSPNRILEMGCSAGNSATAWYEAFPESQVHAIDVGESLLRYAHARAEAIECPIHFSQQNAEGTNFEDESFDVIVSHIMMHETSTAAVSNIFAESRRLLKPGGVMLHMDLPRLDELLPVDSFLASWEVYNNNEAFGGTYRTMDVLAETYKAGFSKEKVRLDQVEFIHPPKFNNYQSKVLTWPAVVGMK